MIDSEGAAESRTDEPRPAFLGRLRDVVRIEAGSAPVPGPPVPEAERILPAIPGIEIHHEIGRGGMGTVYRARQIGLDRIVALKLVWLGRGNTVGNAIRLAKGPRAIASLAHPHIIQVHQVGKLDGWVYGVFEYLDGGDLKGALRDGPWPPDRAAALVRTLAEAVQFMHERGIIHRDLKCSNVLLSADGAPKIADFGLVKLVGDVETTLEESGSILGTPSSMAPEQASGQSSAVGPAVDIHALGVILHELLVGRPPFTGPTHEETLRQVIEMVPAPPSRLRPESPRALDVICRRCLEKDPGRRYSNARELAGALEEYLGRAKSPPTSSGRHREAEQARARAEADLDDAERALYLSRLALADRELERGDRAAARSVLNECIPRPGRPDRRDLRWSELWGRCQGD
jgi:serine/threonine-protein kinase